MVASSEPVTNCGVGGHQGEAAKAECEKDEVEHNAPPRLFAEM